MKYQKDQANDKDYSQKGVGFSFKRWQADSVAKNMKSEVANFEANKGADKKNVREYGSGTSARDTFIMDI